VILPLLAGILIYALWRGIHILHVKPLLTSPVTGWVTFNLPDGLWLYALLSSLVLIWEGSSLKNLVFWTFTALLFSFIAEIAQGWGIVPGTFDWFDMLAYLIAFVLVIIQNQKILKSLPITLKILKYEN
jgi:hypothetical protein